MSCFPRCPLTAAADRMNAGVLPLLPLWLFSCHFNTARTDTTPPPGTKGMCIICKVMMSPHLYLCMAPQRQKIWREALFWNPLFKLQHLKLVCRLRLPSLQRTENKVIVKTALPGKAEKLFPCCFCVSLLLFAKGFKNRRYIVKLTNFDQLHPSYPPFL